MESSNGIDSAASSMRIPQHVEVSISDVVVGDAVRVVNLLELYYVPGRMLTTNHHR